VSTVLPRQCAAAAELAVGAGWHALLLSRAGSIAARGVTEVPFFHACTCLHRCAVHDGARTRHCVDVLPAQSIAFALLSPWYDTLSPTLFDTAPFLNRDSICKPIEPGACKIFKGPPRQNAFQNWYTASTNHLNMTDSVRSESKKQLC